MRKLLTKSGVVFDYINSGLVWLLAALAAFCWFSICYEVLLRYFLNRPTIWALSIVEKILAIITFLGAAWLLKKGGHVKIDVLELFLPKRWQMVLEGITSVLSALVCFVLTWYGAQVVIEQFQTGSHDPTVLALPQGPFYMVIPIGFFLLFIQYLRNAYGCLVDWRSLQEGSSDNGNHANYKEEDMR
ncbi:MAG: TRAP transporter small permease [Deltaproteobacteria bacterium]|nr:TRAP transporter small permease [Deltaproteobacteria bacterium]